MTTPIYKSNGPSGGANFARLQIVLFPIPYGGNEDEVTKSESRRAAGIRLSYEAERLMVHSGTFTTYDTYTSSNKYVLWFIWKLSGRLGFPLFKN